MNDTLALMEFFLGPPTSRALERVSDVGPSEMAETLGSLHLEAEVIEELVTHWEETRDNSRWASLLAAMGERARRDRGNIDADVAIWPDLDEYGPSGRLLFYYLFALEVEGLLAWYAERGVPRDVVEATIGALARHGETHRLNHGTIGLDAGWWMLLILRGEILQVGSLKFHAVNLEVGTLAPRPWLDADAVERYGAGFRAGDLSFGIHIPARIDLSARALDATFARAREVLPGLWPASTRRIATCQSWMMDDRLGAALGEDSRVVRFQRRFELIEPYYDDLELVLHFVFGLEGVRDLDVTTLRATSRLQQMVKDVLVTGDHWRCRTGWLDFD